MTKVKYSQYEPIVVEDEYGNKYLCINFYEATSVKNLITELRRDKVTKYNTGDWWLDLPIKIRGFLKDY